MSMNQSGMPCYVTLSEIITDLATLTSNEFSFVISDSHSRTSRYPVDTSSGYFELSDFVNSTKSSWWSFRSGIASHILCKIVAPTEVIWNSGTNQLVYLPQAKLTTYNPQNGSQK